MKYSIIGNKIDTVLKFHAWMSDLNEFDVSGSFVQDGWSHIRNRCADGTHGKTC